MKRDGRETAPHLRKSWIQTDLPDSIGPGQLHIVAANAYCATTRGYGLNPFWLAANLRLDRQLDTACL